jgi:transcription elongation GreA/GreB family factor
MSRAFVKESDTGDPGPELPERPVSEHPNLVTPEGLALIEANLETLRQQQAAAQASGDGAALARIGRDLRYWSARRPADRDRVYFGSTVTLGRQDGVRKTYRVVGEDEANPAQGTLSFVSPVARALLGKEVGEAVQAGPSEMEILAIE